MNGEQQTANDKMDVIIFQTSDEVRYRRMLNATSRTALEFCQRHGFRYESYIGVKRGFHGWQASFNRIYQFKELADRGYKSWAIYLDADAYIHDLDFDLVGYLQRKRDYAGIMTTIEGASEPWNINSGVILLDFSKPTAHRLIDAWMKKFLELSSERLLAEHEMQEFDNDQHMLSAVLSGNEDIRSAIYYEDYQTINSMNAHFIRQQLRAFMPSVEERTRSIELMVDEILGRVEPESPIDKAVPAIVAALYRVILRRDPDTDGLLTSAEQIRRAGIERGTAEVLGRLLESEEYRRLVGGAGA